jgi:alanyl-tRNA synthetase
MGEAHPSGDKLVDAQKCVRTGDIDEVGDETHLTFFEMLGNWSLGSYFKDESIRWSYELLTSESGLGIDPSRLAVSVFEGDDDSAFDEVSFNLWKELGMPEARIAKLGKDDNWWPAGGKHTGPQGPDTEIFYWTGDEPAPEAFDPENELWVEIWNNVFMEFHKDDEGNLTPLKKKNVDTGMGLERVVAVLNGVKSPYETDVFSGILEVINSLTESDYEGEKTSFRVIADHMRTSTVMVSDGVMPSNKDQGYILRRLVRRAVRHARKLNIDAAQMVQPIVEAVDASLGEAYPNIREKKADIIEAISAEVQKFERTLEKGLREFTKLYEKQGEVNGEDAFNLYQTFGFPFELTEELAREEGQDVSAGTFRKAFEEHQEKSRQGSEQKFAGGLAGDTPETRKLHTATHLLHQALRTVLGDHVEQRGSNITNERLRFDFSHGEKMTPEQKEEVERIVNEQINKALPVTFEVMDIDAAKESGVIGLFDDKYAQIGGKVKVYRVGSDEEGYFSREICGGPHVENTSELGSFRIKKEESSSAGVRRIKAVLG